MQLLAVPNWSFGREAHLVGQCRQVLTHFDVSVHYCQGDPDHNRTVTAFSGDAETVRKALLALCSEVLPSVDLSVHEGVHPRVGALDVCPFVPLDGHLDLALRFTEEVAAEVSGRFGVPIYLYEYSERGHHAVDLPSLRKGGFAGLLGRELTPDFGPSRAHPQWGLTVMGVRDFLLALNVNLATVDPTPAKEIARRIRQLREEGDPRFTGVRSLGFPLTDRGQSQVSINVTDPDIASVDIIVQWVHHEAEKRGITVADTELIGVIRRQDLITAQSLSVDPAQVVG